MNKIVTLKGPSVDSQDEYVLTECLKIMFPNCEVEIQSAPGENSRNEEDQHTSGTDQVAQP